MRPRYESSPLDESMKGLTCWFGWMATVNFPDMIHNFEFEKLTKGLHLESEIPRNYLEFSSTVTHETLHFIQALSTSYVYRSACLLLREITAVVKQIKQLPSDALVTLPLQVASSIGTLFDQMNVKSSDLSTSGIRGISALDLIEGATIFTDHRIHLPQLNNYEYLRRIETQYSRGNLRVYSDAYRLAEWYLGEEIFDIFSVICYLALCSENPGKTFCQYLRVLGLSGILRTHTYLTVQEVIDLGASAGIRELRTAFQESDVIGQHPILFPYMENLEKNLPEEFSFVNFAARPYECKNSDIFVWMLPPLLRFWGGTGITSPRLPNFLSKATSLSEEAMDKDNIDFVASLTTICGAVLAMLQPGEYHLQCQHTHCPYYRLHLCHSYIAVPPTYQECGFPELFEEIFGRPLSVMGLEQEKSNG